MTNERIEIEIDGKNNSDVMDKKIKENFENVSKRHLIVVASVLDKHIELSVSIRHLSNVEQIQILKEIIKKIIEP